MKEENSAQPFDPVAYLLSPAMIVGLHPLWDGEGLS